MTRFELRPAEGSEGFKGTMVVISDRGTSVSYEVDLKGDAQGVLVEETPEGFHVDAFWLRP